jgi:hypothetical protein
MYTYSMDMDSVVDTVAYIPFLYLKFGGNFAQNEGGRSFCSSYGGQNRRRARLCVMTVGISRIPLERQHHHSVFKSQSAYCWTSESVVFVL